ncbi:MAG: radical SAM protein [Endomicrobia bacterium]|nr:radical SAM protein [Endomicrobiia bacterium]
MSDILIVWPDEQYVMKTHTKIPKRWAYLIEIVSYLEKFTQYSYDVVDCLDPKFSIGEVMGLVAKNKYKLVICVSRIENIVSVSFLSDKIKKILPNTNILLYGDICAYAPNYFKNNLNIDAIVTCGDWEISISEYADYIFGKKQLDEVTGITYKQSSIWHSHKKGNYVSDWELPNTQSKYLFDLNTYNTITNNEITLSVGRGCPFDCKFCTAVITFGLKDRRKKPEEIVAYMKENSKKFKSFKLFSPTLTYNTEWVKTFCSMLIKENLNIPWCGTTRIDTLNDDEMKKLIVKSGCYKLAIGFETLDLDSSHVLSKHKEANFLEKAESTVKFFTSNKVEINSLMMLGIKGQTRENICLSFSKLQEWGANIRASAYSPREYIREWDADSTKNLSFDEIMAFDKMTYLNNEIPGVSYSQFLDLVYNTENYKKILNY